MTKLSCLNPACPLHREVGSGNIVRYGFYRTRSGKRRRQRCVQCGKTFSSTRGTPYYRLEHRRATFDAVVSLRVERKQPDTGYPRLTTAPGASPTNVAVRYAWATENGNDRSITVLVERCVPMFGSARKPKTSDCDLSLLTLNLDADGSGTGKMVSGVKVKLDDGRIVIESVLTEPIDLLNVMKRK